MEQIGLEGVFSLGGFDAGMAKYMAGIKKANAETAGAASSFSKSFGSMGASVNHVAGIMGTVFVGAAVAAGAAVGAFVARGIGQAEAMEKQMSGIAAIMGKTQAEVKPLADEIIKLGLDPHLMVDATQAADAIQQLAKNGLSMDQILQGAAKSTVLLANATKADFGEAANIATGAMKLFNIDAKDMDKAVSGIVSVTTNSKFTIQDYALALAQGGGAAKAAHVSFADFNTVIASTSSYFSSGGDAATSFKTFLTRLIPTTSASADMMKKLGLFTGSTAKEVDDAQKGIAKINEQIAKLDPTSKNYATRLAELQTKQAVLNQINQIGQNQFFDTAGNMKNMADVSGILQKSLSGLTAEQRQEALQTIFGADAFRTAIGLADQGSASFTKMQEKMGLTNAADQAATRMNNLAGVMEILKGAVDAISLSIGQAFLPILTRMAQGVSQFVSDHGQQIIDFFQNTAGAIEAFASGTPTDFPWEDIFPPWLATVAYQTSQVFEGLITVVGDFRKGTLGADYSWDKVFPPGIAQIASAVATAVQFVSDNFTAFAGALAGVAAVLASAAIYSALTGIAAAIAAISLPMVALIGAAALLGAAWNANWFGIRDATMPILMALGDGINNLIADFAPLTAAVATSGAGALQEIQNFVTGNETSFANLKAIWDGLTQTASTVFSGLATAIANALPGFIVSVYGFAAVAVSWIGDALPNAILALGDYVTGLINYLSGTGTTQMSGSTNGMVSALIDWITNDLVPKVGPAMLNFGLALAEAVGKIAVALGIAAGEIGLALINAVAAHLPDWTAGFTAWGTVALAWLTDVITNAPTKLGEWYTALSGALAPHLEAWKSSFAEWSAPAVDWLATATTNAPAKIAEWYTALTTALSPLLTGWTTSFTAWASPAVDWITTDLVPKVGPAMLAFGVALAEAIAKIAAALSISAGEISTSIISALSNVDWSATGTTILNGIVAGLSAIGTLISTGVKIATDAISAEFSGIDWNSVGVTVITDIAAGLGKIGTLISTAVKLATDAISTEFSDVTWKDVGTTVLKAVMGGISAYGTLVSTAVKLTTDAISAAFEGVDWKNVGTVVLTATLGGISAYGTLVSTAIKLVTDAISTAFTATDWKKVGTDILTAIVGGLSAVGTVITTASKLVTDAIATAFTGVDWKSTGVAILTALVGGISAIGSVVTTASKTVTDAIVKNFTTDVDWKTDVGSKILTAIGTNFTADSLKTSVTTVTDGTKAAFTTAIKWDTEVGGYIITTVSAGLAVSKPLLDQVATVGADVLKAFTNIDWASIGKAIIDGIGTGLTDAAKTLKEKLDGILKDLEQKAKDIIGFGSPAREYIPLGASIVDGLIVGIQSRTAALQNQMRSLLHVIPSSVDLSDIFMDWSNSLYGANRSLSDFSSAFSDIISLGKSWLDLNKGMKGAADFTQSLAGYDRFNQKLSDRIKLLDIIRQNSLNPSTILAGKNISAMTPEEIAHAIQESASYLALATQGRLAQEQKELQRIYDLQGATKQYTDQLARLQDLAKAPMNFFQQIEFDQAQKQFDELTTRLDEARKRYLSSGSDEEKTLINSLLSQRATLLQQIRQSQPGTGRGTPQNSLLTSVLNQQSQMLDDAQKLGWNTAQIFNQFFSNADSLSTEALQKMAMLQNALDSAKLDDLRKTVAEKANKGFLDGLNTNFSLSGIASSIAKTYADKILTPLLDKIKQNISLDNQRNQAINEYNAALQVTQQLQSKQGTLDYLNQQIDLIGQAKGAGLSLSSILHGLSLGTGTNINDLLTIANRLMDSLVQKAQAQLTPAAIKLADHQAEVDAKQKQLDLLNQQLNILQQAKADGESFDQIFAGLTVGMNATSDDLLTAQGRLLDKLIKHANEKLQIHSPSKVFASMGENVVRGLQIGMQQAFARPLFAPASNVSHSAVSSRTLNMNMGGVTINTPMDDVLFESRVMRVVERAFH